MKLLATLLVCSVILLGCSSTTQRGPQDLVGPTNYLNADERLKGLDERLKGLEAIADYWDYFSENPKPIDHFTPCLDIRAEYGGLKVQHDNAPTIISGLHARYNIDGSLFGTGFVHLELLFHYCNSLNRSLTFHSLQKSNYNDVSDGDFISFVANYTSNKFVFLALLQGRPERTLDFNPFMLWAPEHTEASNIEVLSGSIQSPHAFKYLSNAQSSFGASVSFRPLNVPALAHGAESTIDVQISGARSLAFKNTYSPGYTVRIAQTDIDDLAIASLAMAEVLQDKDGSFIQTDSDLFVNHIVFSEEDVTGRLVDSNIIGNLPPTFRHIFTNRPSISTVSTTVNELYSKLKRSTEQEVGLRHPSHIIDLTQETFRLIEYAEASPFSSDLAPNDRLKEILGRLSPEYRFMSSWLGEPDYGFLHGFLEDAYRYESASRIFDASINFLIYHELAHAVLNHHESTEPPVSQEFEADLFATIAIFLQENASLRATRIVTDDVDASFAYPSVFGALVVLSIPQYAEEFTHIGDHNSRLSRVIFAWNRLAALSAIRDYEISK